MEQDSVTSHVRQANCFTILSISIISPQAKHGLLVSTSISPEPLYWV